MSKTYYIETYNGAKYKAIAWFSNYAEAEAEMMWMLKTHPGFPPRIIEEPFPPGIRTALRTS